MKAILTHFSETPIETLHQRKYEPLRDGPITFKPQGLWLSDESGKDGWKSWCEGEKFRLEGLKYSKEFECDTFDWAVLKSPEDIHRFSSVYKCKRSEELGLKSGYVCWDRVMKDYKGILITPYQWDCRLDGRTFWYYPWDCASACVWDLSTVKPIGEKQWMKEQNQSPSTPSKSSPASKESTDSQASSKMRDLKRPLSFRPFASLQNSTKKGSDGSPSTLNTPN